MPVGWCTKTVTKKIRFQEEERYIFDVGTAQEHALAFKISRYM